MKFEIIKEGKVYMWTEERSCIPDIEELTAMSKARIPYKFRLNGKAITLKKLKEFMNES
jgi:hypothetical protein